MLLLICALSIPSVVPSSFSPVLAASIRHYTSPTSKAKSHFHIWLFDAEGKGRQVTFGNDDDTAVSWTTAKNHRLGWLTFIREPKDGNRKLESLDLDSGKMTMLAQPSDISYEPPMGGVGGSYPLYRNYEKASYTIKAGKAIKGPDIIRDRSGNNAAFSFKSPYPDHPGEVSRAAGDDADVHVTFGAKPSLADQDFSGWVSLPPIDIKDRLLLPFWTTNSTDGPTTAVYVVDWQKQAVRPLIQGYMIDYRLGRKYWAYATNRDLSDYGKGKTVWTNTSWLMNSFTGKKLKLAGGLAITNSIYVSPTAP